MRHRAASRHVPSAPAMNRMRAEGSAISENKMESGDCTHCVVLYMGVLDDLGTDFGTVQMVLSTGVPNIVCAFLRAVELGENL